MKKIFLPFLLILFSCFLSYGQVIDNFDNAEEDSTYQNNIENETSVMTRTNEPTDKVEGSGALRIKASVGSINSWGSYAQLIKRVPDGEELLNWETSDSLSLWIKVVQAPSIPASVVFRIHIADRPTPDDPIEEYIYEHATILDEVTDWVQLKVPLFERPNDQGLSPNDEGFVVFPHAWGGGNYNNEILDRDAIVGYNISFITTTTAADSIEYLVDNFERTGIRAVPFIVFNGKTVPTNLTPFTWGQSSISIEENMGSAEKKNAIKWVQGDEWANGWTGFGWDIAEPVNMSGAWVEDSIKLKVKAPSGTGPIRVQFESGADGKMGYVIDLFDDDQWHTYSAALRDFLPQDETTNFDSSSVIVFGIMAEASAEAGRILYFDDIWTGNPVIDVVAPDAPEDLAIITGGDFTNTVTWSDVPGEEGETYDIYFSRQEITNIDDAEVVKLKVEQGEEIFVHLLRAPAADQEVTFYYAITCTDAAGNMSPAAILSSGVTNTAKGVAVISLSTPEFTADGDLSEWSGIMPMHMAPSAGGFIPPNQTVTDDEDLSLDAYIAMDETYLYVALDIEDNVVSYDNATSYLNDAPDLFIGLYNGHGRPHVSYQRDEQPDYHIRFAFDRAMLDGLAGGDSILVPGENYYWDLKFPTGYAVEARIPWTVLAERGGDNLFVPVEGYRIPIDFSINDKDDGTEREGILTYSPYNNDLSYQDPSRWLYTWIGDKWDPVVGVDDDDNLVNTYSLSQNYPNPFNPSTKIEYSLKEQVFVTLKVYDVLGRLVTTLVNGEQTSGMHSIIFNASGFTSGVYFYKLEAGSFSSIKKMILIK